MAARRGDGASRQRGRACFACSSCIKFISRVPGTIELNKQRFSITFRALLSSLFMFGTHTCVVLRTYVTGSRIYAANLHRCKLQSKSIAATLRVRGPLAHTRARATHFQYFRSHRGEMSANNYVKRQFVLHLFYYWFNLCNLFADDSIPSEGSCRALAARRHCGILSHAHAHTHTHPQQRRGKSHFGLSFHPLQMDV